MLTNECIVVIKEVTERPNGLSRSVKNARNTVTISLKVTNYTNDFIHKSLLLGWLGKIP